MRRSPPALVTRRSARVLTGSGRHAAAWPPCWPCSCFLTYPTGCLGTADHPALAAPARLRPPQRPWTGASLHASSGRGWSASAGRVAPARPARSAGTPPGGAELLIGAGLIALPAAPQVQRGNHGDVGRRQPVRAARHNATVLWVTACSLRSVMCFRTVESSEEAKSNVRLRVGTGAAERLRRAGDPGSVDLHRTHQRGVEQRPGGGDGQAPLPPGEA